MLIILKDYFCDTINICKSDNHKISFKWEYNFYYQFKLIRNVQSGEKHIIGQRFFVHFSNGWCCWLSLTIVQYFR